MFEGDTYDNYIEKWRLHTLVNDAVMTILTDLPEDPYAALADIFRSKKSDCPSRVSSVVGGGRRMQDATLNDLMKEVEDRLLAGEVADSRRVRDLASALDASQRTRSGGTFPVPEVASPTMTSTTRVRHIASTVNMLGRKKSALQGFKNQGPNSPPNEAHMDTKILKKLLSIALELEATITDSGDTVLKVIIESAQELLAADRCSLFVIQGRYLVSEINKNEKIKLHIGSGLAGHCAQSGKAINLKNAYDDARFNKKVDRETGYRTQSLLCAPIFCDNEVVAVAQLLNKKTAYGAVTHFTENDLDLFQTFAAFAGMAIYNAQVYQEQQRLMQKNAFFLGVLEKLTEADMRNWGEVVHDVAQGATEVLMAEKCSLFLVDKETNELWTRSEMGEIRFPSWKGIAGHVYSSGEVLHITDPYQDPRFNSEVDKKTGMVTRNLLTMPVKYKDQVIAVVQVMNKMGSECFTEEDETTLECFAHFAGVTLNNSNLYDFVLESRDKAMSLFEGQMQLIDRGTGAATSIVSTGNELDVITKAYAAARIPVDDLKKVVTPDFDIHSHRSGEKRQTLVPLLVHLFERLDIITTLNIPRAKFVRFVAAVEKKYRGVPYHNFVHACDVVQTMFTYLMVYDCKKYLNDLEVLALMCSALLHDIDHMGLNNSFHFKTESPLGMLSAASGSSAVLEVHHCHISLQLLNSDEVNIFSEMSKEQRALILRLIVGNILATDMSKHEMMFDKFMESTEGGISRDSEPQREIIGKILLKACDISNVTKPFEISKLWGIAITDEFRYSGDKEVGPDLEAKLDEKAELALAKTQLSFIDACAHPAFEKLASRMESTKPVLEQLDANIKRWRGLLGHLE